MHTTMSRISHALIKARREGLKVALGRAWELGQRPVYNTEEHVWYQLDVNAERPRREFVERGVYRWMRHPVYLSFLGLIWFTPRMTADHAMLTGVWTVYIFVGSCLKDRRMTFYLGDTYREYASRVSGFPGVFFGTLGKWRKSESTRPVADIVIDARVQRAA